MHSSIQQKRKYRRLANVLSWVVGVYYLVAAGVALLPIQGHPVLWERICSALEMVIAGSTSWLLLKALALVVEEKDRSAKRDTERRKFANWLHRATIGFPVLLILANIPSGIYLYQVVFSFGFQSSVSWALAILSISGTMAFIGLFYYFLLEFMCYMLL